jgi:hypothetical protein
MARSISTPICSSGTCRPSSIEESGTARIILQVGATSMSSEEQIMDRMNAQIDAGANQCVMPLRSDSVRPPDERLLAALAPH